MLIEFLFYREEKDPGSNSSFVYETRGAWLVFCIDSQRFHGTLKIPAYIYLGLF